MMSIHPNPTSTWAEITVEIPTAGNMRLRVVDMLGRTVALLTDSYRAGGTHRFRWLGTSPGTYIVRLESEAGASSGKLTRVK